MRADNWVIGPHRWPTTRDNQIETGQIIDENLPAEQLEQAEEDEPDKPSIPFSNEEHKLINFLNKTIFKINGTRQFPAISTKKYLLSEYMNVDAITYQFAKNINQIFIDEIMNILNQRREGNKKAARIEIQDGLKRAF